ncbi:hypothetical protein AALP_AA1G090600 [Arabis alpina]|uniref:Uncharacterized protein n=1 Tax=Arabis alpina TaxID=50452 RepID=A0A087HM30_ARAAL|nr:hypothetical protein AALP_AA1G090600 [Arabis alpina]
MKSLVFLVLSGLFLFLAVSYSLYESLKGRSSTKAAKEEST